MKALRLQKPIFLSQHQPEKVLDILKRTQEGKLILIRKNRKNSRFAINCKAKQSGYQFIRHRTLPDIKHYLSVN